MTHGPQFEAYLAEASRVGTHFGLLPATERRAMLEEDLFAGRTVSLVLSAIVAGGMLLMAATVAYIVF